MKNCVPV